MRHRGLAAALLLTLAACGWARAHHLSPETRRRAAREALASGDLERLQYELVYLTSAPELEPWANLVSGTLLLAARRPAAARDRLEIAAAREETRTRAQVLMGEAWYQQGNVLQAGAVWTEVLETAPDDVDANRWLAAAYYDLGARLEALRYLRKVVRLAPDDARPYRVIGLIYASFGKATEAAEAYQESLRLAPEQPEALAIRLELAEARHLLGQNPAALATLESLPISSEVLALRAECLLDQGRLDLAQTRIDEALSLDSHDVKALVLNGRVRLLRGKPKLAAESLERAFKLAPGDLDVLLNYLTAAQQCDDASQTKQLEQLVLEATRLRDADQELTEQASNKPADVGVRIQLGSIAERRGLNNDAKMWYRAALLLDPANQPVAAALVRLRAADDPLGLEDDHSGWQQ